MGEVRAVLSERAYIGAVVNGDARLLDSGLRRSDFSDAFCADLYDRIARLEAQGRRADLVTLCDDDTMDAQQLIELTSEAAPVASLAAQHAGNIIAAAQRRRLHDVCIRAAQIAREADTPLEETIAKLRAYLDKLSERSDDDGTVTGTDALVDFYNWISSGEADPASATGIASIDHKLGGGLKDGRFYVIGARPGVGKSAIMSVMACQAIRDGRRVLYVSLEMGARELVTRMVSSVSGVSVGSIMRKTLAEQDYTDIADCFSLLPGGQFRFGELLRTPDALRRAALQMRAREGLDVIFVDYLQLMRCDTKTSNRTEAVGEISRSLKLLAMELGVPVVAAAQLNRAAAGNTEPRLSDLRESGSIEQDADVVILLHAPDEPDGGLRRTEVCVAKNRQGTCGATTMWFDGEHMRFMQEEGRYGHI